MKCHFPRGVGRALAPLLLLLVAAGPAAAQSYVPPVHDSIYGRSSLDTPAGFGLNRGIGVNSVTGDVYVTDDKLRRFDANGNLLASWSCTECYGIDANTVTHDIYVARRSSKMITQYQPDGTFVREWGGSGTIDGKFSNPIDVAVDTANGEVYVIDGTSVQVFDLTGTFLRRFGTIGPAPDQFSGTSSFYQIAYDEGTQTVWTADTPADRIQAWDRFGNFIRSWEGNDTTAFGDFRWARGIDTAANGDVYITDADNERVTSYSPLGVALVEYQGPHNLAEGAFHPRSIAINQTTGERYVAAGYAFRVDKFDANDNFLFSWGDREIDGVALNDPLGLAVSQVTGDVFVMDSRHFIMKRFSANGVFLNQWGGSIRIDGLADGLFGFADVPVATDSQGNVWVATDNIHYKNDPFSHHLQKFLPDGTFVLGVQPQVNPAFGYSEFMFGAAIDPSTDLVYVSDAHPARNRIRIHDSAGIVVGSIDDIPNPAGIAIHQDLLYVASTLDNTIRKYRLTGTGTTADLLRIFGGGPELFLLKESGLATDAGGSIFVADSQNHMVRVYAPNGALLTSFGGPGSAPGQFRLPRGVAIHKTSGELHVLDSGRNRVQKYLLSLDNDGDTVPDTSDNCVYAPNTTQDDGGGIGPGSAPDGIGDACQCGDLDLDTDVDGDDLARYRAALAGLAGGLSATETERCSVIGGRRDCSVLDVVVLTRALASLGPDPVNVCAP